MKSKRIFIIALAAVLTMVLGIHGVYAEDLYTEQPVENVQEVIEETAAVSEPVQTQSFYEPEVQPEAVPQPQPEPQPEIAPQYEATPQPEVVPQVSESQQEVVPQPQPEAQPEIIPQYEAAPQPEAVVQPEMAPQSVVTMQPEAVVQPEVIPQSQSEQQPEIALQQGAVSQQEPIQQPEQSQAPSQTQQPAVKLDFMPIELKAEIPELLVAGSFCKAKLEIKNNTNQYLENLEIVLSSGDDNYVILSYEEETEALQQLELIGFCTEGDYKNTERVLRVRSLPAGTTIKTEVLLYTFQDLMVNEQGISADINCELSVSSVRYCSTGTWKLIKEQPEEVPQENPEQPGGEPQEGPEQPEGEPQEDPTEIPQEEPAETIDEQPEQSAEVPSEGTADHPEEQTPSEKETPEQPAETTQEEPVEQPAEEAEVAQEPAEEAGEEQMISENIAEQTSTEDEMITFEVISDGEEETEELEEEYYDDWGYYSDWVTYSDYDGVQINTATPYVLVKSYSHKRTINTGDEFGMEITFLNTSQKVNMENVVIKVETSDSLSLANGTNTLFVPGIEAGGTTSQTLNLLAAAECKDATQKINLSVSFEYIENKERKQGTATESITIPVSQKDRLELRDPVIDEMQAGKEGVISLSYVNKGYTSLYNMEASLELENAYTEETIVYAGNVESGKSGSLDFLVTPEEEGEYTGQVTLTYEDASQSQVSVVVPLTFTSSMAYVEEYDYFEDEMFEYEEEQAEMPITTVMIIAGALIAAAAVILCLVRRKKKIKAENDIVLDDWFNDKKEG